MLGHILKGGTLGNGVAEKRVTATEQAVETPRGGTTRTSMMNVPCHLRAVSRSGGATSAERDGRPVERRTFPDVAAGSRSISTHDSCARHVFFWHPLAFLSENESRYLNVAHRVQ
jgi:hypothetical protein